MNKIDEYDFKLDDELIAQTPLKKRDESRLLVLNRESETIEHKKFTDILDYLDKDDVLVLNNSRVLPARLFGQKKDTAANVEVLLLKETATDIWQCMCKPAKRIKVGTIIHFSEELEMECLEVLEEGIRVFKLYYQGILYETLEKLGTMPLPPYIKETLADQERYQTIYSKIKGSAAAPTAGLHFSEELLEQIIAKGVEIANVTLHVGLGTFKPVSVEDIDKHKMHSEYYYLDEKNAAIINNAKANNKRIISVGTTTTRTLESIAKKHGIIKADSGYTDIFIYPGFKFETIDVQITNFHLPKSTLLMLVSAFASKELIMKAYQEAIKERYRFFSFGDCMIII
ncbi:tRNA preQ1(34) S-adenosylmethionine ribosyltransferase-isomerase QueA [Erysipelotrichaceae bacterium OttesenSCG-928-M19]|nr:tRNA preQ1(34) S-adenosylmethionine ribosyltransferase-isomerase QueA [Erysipelotrichaceae bacterium OttesenSCG-928-M19]